MGKGFFIRISNRSNVFQEAYLFSKKIPKGIEIHTYNGLYDFNALKKVATVDGFTGNSITSDYDKIIQLEIINDGLHEQVELLGRFEKKSIKIDGKENTIKIICPPNSNFTLRLFQLPIDFSPPIQ